MPPIRRRWDARRVLISALARSGDARDALSAAQGPSTDHPGRVPCSDRPASESNGVPDVTGRPRTSGEELQKAVAAMCRSPTGREGGSEARVVSAAGARWRDDGVSVASPLSLCRLSDGFTVFRIPASNPLFLSGGTTCACRTLRRKSSPPRTTTEISMNLLKKLLGAALVKSRRCRFVHAAGVEVVCGNSTLGIRTNTIDPAKAGSCLCRPAESWGRRPRGLGEFRIRCDRCHNRRP